MALNKEDVREIKEFLGDKVEEATKDLKQEVESLREEVERLKAQPVEVPDGRIEVKENPKQKWAEYYKNLFYAVYPQPQAVVRTRDGAERQIVITPERRAKALETLEKLAGGEVEKAAMGEGTGSAGGYLVPTPQDLVGEVLRIAEEASVVLREANVFPMRSMTLPLTSESTGVSVAWVDEAAAISESEPTLARTTLTAKKLAAYSIVSNELLADADAAVVDYLNTIFGEAIGQALDSAVFAGTGIPVSGLLTLTGVNEVVMSTGDTGFDNIDADYLSDMIDDLKPSVLRNAKFYYHRTIEHYIRTLKDTNGNYIMQSPSDKAPPAIWGYERVLVEAMPTKSDSAVSKAFVIFGDLKRYMVGRRQDISMALDPYGLFTTDQVRVRVVSRWALGTVFPSAFSRLVTAAA